MLIRAYGNPKDNIIPDGKLKEKKTFFQRVWRTNYFQLLSQSGRLRTLSSFILRWKNKKKNFITPSNLILISCFLWFCVWYDKLFYLYKRERKMMNFEIKLLPLLFVVFIRDLKEKRKFKKYISNLLSICLSMCVHAHTNMHTHTQICTYIQGVHNVCVHFKKR